MTHWESVMVIIEFGSLGQWYQEDDGRTGTSSRIIDYDVNVESKKHIVDRISCRI